MPSLPKVKDILDKPTFPYAVGPPVAFIATAYTVTVFRDKGVGKITGILAGVWHFCFTSVFEYRVSMFPVFE
jgi:hypothetical protein